MQKSLLRNNKIMELEQKIQKGNNQALEEFWCEIEKHGTPLIEKIEGNLDNDCWMSTQFKEIDKLPLKFYLNIGILENKNKMVDTNINLRNVLISKEYNVDFEEFKSGHDYLCWGETLANGLISLIGTK